jgi:plasmid stabilization system protein ParE
MSQPRFKVRYLADAENDLYGIANYIAEDNPRAADRMIDRFERAIARLEFSPFAGKVPDDDDELRRTKLSHVDRRQVSCILQSQRNGCRNSSHHSRRAGLQTSSNLTLHLG